MESKGNLSDITKMNEEYIKWLQDLGDFKKPSMPSFDVSAYTENEYGFAIQELNSIFDNIDDFYLTIQFLKGE